MPSMQLLVIRRLPWQLRFTVNDRPREPRDCTSAQCLSSGNYQPSRILYSPSLIFIYRLSRSIPPSSTGLVAQIAVFRDVFVRIENSLCFHLRGASTILWRRRIGRALVVLCGAVTDGLVTVVRRVLTLDHLDPELLNVLLAAKVNTRSVQGQHKVNEKVTTHNQAVSSMNSSV